MRSFCRFTFHSFTTLLLLAFLGNLLGHSKGAAVDCSSKTVCHGGLTLESRRPTPASPWVPLERKALTNAERLARGLKLLPPITHFRHHAAHAQPSPLPKVTYHGVIQVFNSAGAALGYVQTDTYWTPRLTSDITAAQVVEFALDVGATSGTQLNLQQLNQVAPLLGLVQGRDSTSDDIAPGSFNYLYFDGIFAPGTAPGSTPQMVPSVFSTASGLPKAAESSVWNINVLSGVMSVQWINTDNTTPTTFTFVQSNYLYAGGDPDAFHSRFPAPVIPVTLMFVPT